MAAHLQCELGITVRAPASVDCYRAPARARGMRLLGFAFELLPFILLLVSASGAFCNAQSNSSSASALIDALQKGDYDGALHLSDELIRSEPNSPKLWTLRAVALDRSGHKPDALSAYQRALKLSPDYLPALEGAAQIAYNSQSDEAVPLLRRVIAVKSDDTTAHAMLAMVEFRRQQYAGAANDFAAAGDALNAQPASLLAYAIALARLDRGNEAIPLLQRTLALAPALTAARYDLALLEWRSSAPGDALNTLQPLIDGTPADSQAMRLAAAIHESKNETPQAVELLRAAILANPDDPANYLDFATLSFAHGSYTVGIDMIDAGLTRIPKSAALYMARGVLYGENGNFDEAMADFEHAHTLDPGNTMAASAEGIAESQRHDQPHALERFRAQVREHPNDPLGHYLLAEALSWSGPEQSGANNGKNLSEAIAAANRATRLDPKMVEAWDLLASLYLQNGETERAIAASRTALRLKDSDQQSLYTLILALRKTGSKDELRSLVQRLASLRKQEQSDNMKTARYGRLVEVP